MSKKHKKIYTVLNYIEQLLILASVVTRWVSIFAFASLFGISFRNTSSAFTIKICAITAEIKSISQ